MSLVIEFRTPQNPKARSAGIAANRCFPTIAQPTGATDFSRWNDCAAQSEKPREPPDPPFPEAIRPHSVSRSPDRSPTLRNYR